jgi:hypothetical protein
MKDIPLKTPTYSLKEIEKVTGIHFDRLRDMMDRGLIPIPDIRSGVWLTYSEPLYLKVIAELRVPLLNKVAMETHLHADHKDFQKALYCGAVSQPKVVICKRGYYRDLKKIEKEWEKWLNRPRLTSSQKRQEAGYFSLGVIAKICDVSTSTLYHHIRLGHIKPPSHTLEGAPGKYYRRREKNTIVIFIDKRRKELPFIDAAAPLRGKARKPRKK